MDHATKAPITLFADDIDEKDFGELFALIRQQATLEKEVEARVRHHLESTGKLGLMDLPNELLEVYRVGLGCGMVPEYLRDVFAVLRHNLSRTKIVMSRMSRSYGFSRLMLLQSQIEQQIRNN